MKAIIYARVSSREQEETGYSLDAQIKLAKEYAERKGYSVQKVFSVSESASGKHIRKTFLELLGYAAKHKIDFIFCEKIDRLTRNLKDASIVDEWVREKVGREVHFIKENFILCRDTRAHDNLVWDMKVAIARFYTNNLSEEVRKGQHEKIAQGSLPSVSPLGYQTVGESGHKIHVIDHEKGHFIREMFELYSTGNYSLKALVEEMHKRGFRSKTGRAIPKSRIHSLLSDPFYKGDMRWKKKIYKGSHEPLVTPQTFERVQTILKGRGNKPQFRKHLPVFKAKISCQECGGTVTWEIQKSRWYGHCNHYRNCSQKAWTRQDRVEEQLFPFFDKVAPKSNRVLEWLERALREHHAEESYTHAIKRAEITKAIERADHRMEKAYLDKIDGAIEAALCQKVMEEAKKEKDLLLEALSGLNEAKTAYYQAGYAIHELACRAREIYENEDVPTENKRLLLS